MRMERKLSQLNLLGVVFEVDRSWSDDRPQISLDVEELYNRLHELPDDGIFHEGEQVEVHTRHWKYNLHFHFIGMDIRELKAAAAARPEFAWKSHVWEAKQVYGFGSINPVTGEFPPILEEVFGIHPQTGQPLICFGVLGRESQKSDSNQIIFRHVREPRWITHWFIDRQAAERCLEMNRTAYAAAMKAAKSAEDSRLKKEQMIQESRRLLHVADLLVELRANNRQGEHAQEVVRGLISAHNGLKSGKLAQWLEQVRAQLSRIIECFSASAELSGSLCEQLVDFIERAPSGQQDCLFDLVAEAEVNLGVEKSAEGRAALICALLHGFATAGQALP